MAFGGKGKDTPVGVYSYVKSYALPVYIIVSALFIVYALWSYAMGVVYNAGVLEGQNQALQVGQEQGYMAALEQISEEAIKGCDGFTLTLGESQVIGLINIDCLEMPQDNMMFDDEVFFDE
ncbi:hypothetical protein LAT59_04685 [Candidatus Gracilibacteria bacterium]|nr:hypothetical protein [Candidatus Gracilibacteria bacterium]